MGVVIYLILVIATLIAYKLIFAGKKKDYFLKKGIKHEKPKALIGITNMFVQKKSFPEIVMGWYNDFRDEK
jgi:hypothetical protein